MQNIHVKRYADTQSTGYQAAIEPDDRSWILFVHNNGKPELWRRKPDSQDYQPG